MLNETTPTSNAACSLVFASPHALLVSGSPTPQEDVFFVRHLAYLGYKVADLKSAARFAMEVPIAEHRNENVFALHQSWWYSEAQTRRQLAQMIPGI